MRIFAIKNDLYESHIIVAYLIYYENSKKFYIEISQNIDSNDLPIIFRHFYEKNEYFINSYWSERWVKERIIPRDRQNISQILKACNMKYYDEFLLLLYAKGRCCQDDYYIEEINYYDLPDEILDRFKYKIEDCIQINNSQVLIFFVDETIRKVNLIELLNYNDKIFSFIKNEKPIAIQVEPGGYGISFANGSIIANTILYELGVDIAITLSDIKKIITERVINTEEVSEILNCTRQNVNDLIKRDKIIPIKKNKKNNLFLKNEIKKRLW